MRNANHIKKSLVIAMAMCLFVAMGIHANAKGSGKETICIYVNSGDNYQKQVNELFNSGYQNVDVIFKDLEDDDSCIDDLVVDGVQGQNKSLGPVRTYYIKNVRRVKDYVGKNRIASADASPGIKIKIKQTKKISSTFSGTFGVSNSRISAAIGWEINGSTKISISGEYTVPYKIGKKRVKRGYLDAYPKYKTKKYDVYYGMRGTSSEVKKGTGTVRKTIGITFKKRHTYK